MIDVTKTGSFGELSKRKIKGAMRELQFRPLIMPAMIGIETHHPLARFVTTVGWYKQSHSLNWHYHLTKICHTRSKRRDQYLSGYSEKNDKENHLDRNNLITNGKLRNNIQKATERRRLLFFKISNAKKKTSVDIVNRMKNCWWFWVHSTENSSCKNIRTMKKQPAFRRCNELC